jgi:hypothetical protein
LLQQLQKENVTLKNQKLALQEQLEKVKLEKAKIEKQLEKYIAIANQILVSLLKNHFFSLHTRTKLTFV